MANVLVKQATERSQTLEAYLKAYIRYPDVFRTKEFLRFFNAPLDQVLVWSLIERLSKEPKKMISRKACFAGDLIEVQRMVIAVVNKFARPG